MLLAVRIVSSLAGRPKFGNRRLRFRVRQAVTRAPPRPIAIEKARPNCLGNWIATFSHGMFTEGKFELARRQKSRLAFLQPIGLLGYLPAAGRLVPPAIRFLASSPSFRL